ncbi:MAG: RagB/SusD family nutrient uptake outer membrane protein [Saprospiraceae bacterium]|nr:RagB/SusD family nutrient uptake outer membrane protein [Saprospiraceae bacterium]MBK9688232.1 RagB/SusD family nutrient uptake outer membrane protein [Saprospiraceae bacterium]MBL0081413.1 RagB/SusD family nutrient uptake outer membrane protein [Saprospiraceae bacterium]
MNKIFKPTLITAITFLLVSCSSDFLDRKPRGQLTYDTFFENEDHALQSVNAIYNIFRSWEFTALPYLGATDIISDDSDKGSSENDALYLAELDQFQSNATNATYSSMWTGHYQAIFRANLAIENIPGIEMDENLKARLIAEAKFLRAFCYFRLVQWYGEVPLITSILTEDQFFSQQRAAISEVYGQIEKDLQDAIAVLPESSKYAAADIGRVSKGAARGILAKLYMVKKDYTKAVEQCEAIISSNEYALMPSYAEIFTSKGEQGPESVFEISAVAIQAAVAGPGASPYNMVQGVRGVPNLGWGFNRPSDNLIAAYEPGDPRRQATVIYVGEILPDGSTKVEDNPDILNERYNQKAWVPKHAGLQDNGPGNLRLLRYADILLLAAEAYNELGNGAAALPLVNQIRKRARGTNNFILADIATTDQAQLREKIRKERRIELAMEQHRWFDLVRWGIAGDVMRAAGKPFIDNKHERFPLPQTEIDLSDGVLDQNNGW